MPFVSLTPPAGASAALPCSPTGRACRSCYPPAPVRAARRDGDRHRAAQWADRGRARRSSGRAGPAIAASRPDVTPATPKSTATFCRPIATGWRRAGHNLTHVVLPCSTENTQPFAPTSRDQARCGWQRTSLISAASQTTLARRSTKGFRISCLRRDRQCR